MQADATGPVLGSGREAALTAALSALQAARPQWSTSAYAAELDFYRSEDSRRQYTRDELALKVAYQRQQREQARRDSLGRVAQRRAFLIDSTRQVVLAEQQARQDSVAQAKATARQALEEEATRLEAEEARVVASPARPSAAPKPAARKVVVKAKRSTGPTVYYCASGNRVKYHATSGCRGLARCGASILPMSLRDAEASMEPCKWCY